MARAKCQEENQTAMSWLGVVADPHSPRRRHHHDGFVHDWSFDAGVVTSGCDWDCDPNWDCLFFDIDGDGDSEIDEEDSMRDLPQGTGESGLGRRLRKGGDGKSGKLSTNLG